MPGRRAGDFRAGIAIPLLRSAGFVLALALIGVTVGAVLDTMLAFYAVMAIGIVTLWAFNARLRPNKAQEDAARRRFFGIDQ